MRLSSLLIKKRALEEAVGVLVNRQVDTKERIRMAMAKTPGALARVERGSALGRGPADPGLSVMSWNLLAPLYVRPVDKRTGEIQEFAAFKWAEPADEVLAWEKRWPRLLAELKAAAADVICLQEVQFEPTPEGGFALPEWLAPLTLAGGGECKGKAFVQIRSLAPPLTPYHPL